MKTNTTTREQFNKVAALRFSALLGFAVECGLMNCTEGLFVSLIAEGNKTAEMAKLQNLDGEVDYDAELDETFAYVKLS